MGYQALLFCPDDKTARTLTQVLSELDFTVEACIEPFAAVKKLMGQHFDAVVVDCDNEQNATLLFKSARNSTSNQTSLAVAVVEGQAGVAKAFRIGANLVLTKPINIEQAKGTLRVARGLLRKSDPTKPGSATATGSFAVPTAPSAAPAPVKPVAPKTPVAAKPVAPKPASPAATATFKAPQAPTAKPAAPPAWPAPTTAAKTTPMIQDLPPAAAAEKPPAPATPAPLYNAVLAEPAPPKPASPSVSETKPTITSSLAGSGAASAPAPAREPELSKIEETPISSAATDLFEQPTAATTPSEPSTYVGAAPSFSFGNSTAETESSSGGGKKVLIGVAAIGLIVVAGYFGWSHMKGSNSSSAQPAAVTTPATSSTSAKPVNAQPSPTSTELSKPSPVSQPDITIGNTSNSPSEESEASGASTPSHTTGTLTRSTNTAASTTKPSAEKNEKTEVADQPETPALVIKGGKAPSVQSKAAAPDAPAAPSLIGMGAPSAGLPNLGTSNTNVKPTLQTLSVSQGVSTGLLYKKVAPSYPQNALRMHIEGTVELMATISKSGDITHIKVISGDAQLTKAASDAVKQWKYKPYLLNGEPVEIQTQVTVNFKLPH
jgi:TonB family protein